MAQVKILIVDDEESMCQFLSIMLRKEGYDVRSTESGKEAIRLASEEEYGAVITDIRMAGMDGLDVLAGVHNVDPTLPVIILTAYASQETAIEAVNRGAFYYLTKQAKNEEIKLVIRKALEHRKLRRENCMLKRELRMRHDSRKMIGSSEKMEEVFRLVCRVAVSDSTILVQGESGTGKELIAREIHYASPRAEESFVSINCGALPENLLESELFGHVKGSFTGAVRDKEGLFAVAEGGTFLLDEVGETSPAIQVKLLRVLQEREIIPVGGTRPLSVNVRLVAATNADLEQRVKEGTFRADLYYRLNVIPIHIPPLRERMEDIPLLVDHFLKRCDPTGAKRIDKEAMDLLMRYEWPGNVRELENIVERMVILQEEDRITPEDVPPRIRNHYEGSHLDENVDVINMTLHDLEKRHLLRVLDETNWQKRKASSILGINTSTLYRKLQRYGIER
ncbi:MAG: sigma-54-dependent Fis family transcriptional regulator [Candidatus Eisenbacteria bacterium]|nr:sigma-54-dependent Fis family transcriptional regulator [Candidatus Eisenbacteria bacterium]